MCSLLPSTACSDALLSTLRRSPPCQGKRPDQRPSEPNPLPRCCIWTRSIETNWAAQRRRNLRKLAISSGADVNSQPSSTHARNRGLDCGDRTTRSQTFLLEKRFGLSVYPGVPQPLCTVVCKTERKEKRCSE